MTEQLNWTEKRAQRALSPLPPCGETMRTRLWIRKWIPIRHQMCWTGILYFPVSRNVSDKCLQHKSLSLRYICYTAWTDWDAFDRGPFLTLPTSVLSTSLCTSPFYDLIPWHALESSNLFSSSTLPFFLEDLAQTPFLQVLHDTLRPAPSLRWLDGAHIGCLATCLSMKWLQGRAGVRGWELEWGSFKSVQVGPESAVVTLVAFLVT